MNNELFYNFDCLFLIKIHFKYIFNQLLTENRCKLPNYDFWTEIKLEIGKSERTNKATFFRLGKLLCGSGGTVVVTTVAVTEFLLDAQRMDDAHASSCAKFYWKIADIYFHWYFSDLLPVFFFIGKFSFFELPFCLYFGTICKLRRKFTNER